MNQKIDTEEIYKRGNILNIVGYEVGGNLYTIGKAMKYFDSAISKKQARLGNIGTALPRVNITLHSNEPKN